MLATPLRVAVLGAGRDGSNSHSQALVLGLYKAVQAQAQAFDIFSIDPLNTNSFAQLKTQTWDAILLLGLEQASALEEAKDLAIRSELLQLGLSFNVVYGAFGERLNNALHTLAQLTPELTNALLRPEPPVRWSGPCEVCSDAECEHRMFTALLQR